MYFLRRFKNIQWRSRPRMIRESIPKLWQKADIVSRCSIKWVDGVQKADIVSRCNIKWMGSAMLWSGSCFLSVTLVLSFIVPKKRKKWPRCVLLIILYSSGEEHILCLLAVVLVVAKQAILTSTINLSYSAPVTCAKHNLTCRNSTSMGLVDVFLSAW